MKRKTYRWCVVPQCTNTSVTAPSKLFIDVPRKANIRQKWLGLARRESEGMSTTSTIYFCEDHFDMPNDMENYMRYHVMGFVNKVMLKPGCLPSKFECQTDRKRGLPLSRPAAIKRQRLALVQKDFEQNQLKSITEEASTSQPSDVKVEVEESEYQPETQDEGVQDFEIKVEELEYQPKIQDEGVQDFEVTVEELEYQPQIQDKGVQDFEIKVEELEYQPKIQDEGVQDFEVKVEEVLEYQPKTQDKGVQVFEVKVKEVLEYQPKTQDKGVQVFAKRKYYRSKFTQTH